MKKIIITFGPDGSSNIEASGFVGKACETATAFLIKGLGLTKRRKRKPEYHQAGVGNQAQAGR